MAEQYSGPLQKRKKAELEEIASLMGLDASSAATKRDVEDIVRAGLVKHVHIREDPRFVGLWRSTIESRRAGASESNESSDNDQDYSSEEGEGGFSTAISVLKAEAPRLGNHIISPLRNISDGHALIPTTLSRKVARHGSQSFQQVIRRSELGVAKAQELLSRSWVLTATLIALEIVWIDLQHIEWKRIRIGPFPSLILPDMRAFFVPYPSLQILLDSRITTPVSRYLFAYLLLPLALATLVAIPVPPSTSRHTVNNTVAKPSAVAFSICRLACIGLVEFVIRTSGAGWIEWAAGNRAGTIQGWPDVMLLSSATALALSVWEGFIRGANR